MGTPTKLGDLAAYLSEHPACEMTDLFGVTRPVRFDRAADGGLWFVDAGSQEHYLPVRCGIDRGDLYETGVELDPGGFTMVKFGRTIRVRYVEGISP